MHSHGSAERSEDYPWSQPAHRLPRSGRPIATAKPTTFAIPRPPQASPPLPVWRAFNAIPKAPERAIRQDRLSKSCLRCRTQSEADPCRRSVAQPNVRRALSESTLGASAEDDQAGRPAASAFSPPPSTPPSQPPLIPWPEYDKTVSCERTCIPRPTLKLRSYVLCLAVLCLPRSGPCRRHPRR